MEEKRLLAKVTSLRSKISSLKKFREDQNDTSEDTLSLDQLIDSYENELTLTLCCIKELHSRPS